MITGDVEVNGSAIPATVGQAAFRIVQESLTNVVRHADASCADVHIGLTGGVLDVEVVDDGRGGRSDSQRRARVYGHRRARHRLGGQPRRAPAALAVGGCMLGYRSGPSEHDGHSRRVDRRGPADRPCGLSCPDRLPSLTPPFLAKRPTGTGGAQVRSLRPDVVRDGHPHADMDGLEAMQKITDDRTLDATRVLVLTTFDLDEYVSARSRRRERLPAQRWRAGRPDAGDPHCCHRRLLIAHRASPGD